MCHKTMTSHLLLTAVTVIYPSVLLKGVGGIATVPTDLEEQLLNEATVKEKKPTVKWLTPPTNERMTGQCGRGSGCADAGGIL